MRGSPSDAGSAVAEAYRAAASEARDGSVVDWGLRAVPQFEQNFAVGALTVPHVGQASSRWLPHSMQKRAPARFCVPHRGQVTLAAAAIEIVRKHTRDPRRRSRLWQLAPGRRLAEGETGLVARTTPNRISHARVALCRLVATGSCSDK